MSSSMDKQPAVAQMKARVENDVDHDDDGFLSRAPVKSGSRRWSRNLSAQRHRELNRLNQIERRRQFLELKQQNDLFDQMSFTVNGPTTNSDNDTETVNQLATSSSVDANDNESNQNDGSSRLESRRQVAEVQSKRVDGDCDESINLGTYNKTGQQQATSNGKDLGLTCVSSLEDNTNDDHYGDDKDKADERIENRAEPTAAQVIGELSLKAARAMQIQDQRLVDELDCIDRSATETTKPPSVDLDIDGGEDQPLVKRPAPMTSDQLACFVSSCVPENKRVLCLIVRDKVSRNKAKSYFYPTYYLFIQAIIDIDDSAGASLNQDSSVNSNHKTRRVGDDSDLIGVLDGEFLRRKAANSSVDNSFSASSSISGDMLFIGGATLAPNGTPTCPSPNGAAAGTSGSAAAHTATRMAAGKSYSDDDEGSTSAGSLVHPPATFVNGSRLKRKETSSAGRTIDDELSANDNDSSSEEDDNEDEEEEDSSEKQDNPLKWSIRRPRKRTTRQQQKQPVDGHLSKNPQAGAGSNKKPAASDHDYDSEIIGRDDDGESLFCQNLFDNNQNPYTGTYGVLLAGRRRKKAKTYLIGLNENGYKKNSICKLKSNVLGTQFNAIRLNNQADDNNDRCNIASISYETNVLGFKGPRKMRVFLAKDPDGGVKNLTELFKKNPSAVVQLKNMTPSWNVESQSYVLNFHGRVTQASVKNFQLIESDQSSGQNIESLRHNQSSSSSLSLANSSNNHYDQQTRENRLTTTNTQRMIDTTRNVKADKQLVEDIGDLDDYDYYTGNSRIINPSMLNEVPNDGQTGYLPMTQGNMGLAYNNSIVMQFGRISNHEFTCDVTYPLSILQAFSIALSSFDSKLACE